MGPPPNALPGDGGLSHAQRCINTGRFISYILSHSGTEISNFLTMCRTYAVIFSTRILFALLASFLCLLVYIEVFNVQVFALEKLLILLGK